MRAATLILSLILSSIAAAKQSSNYLESVEPVPKASQALWRQFITNSPQMIYPGLVVIEDSDHEKMLRAAAQWSKVAQFIAGVFYSDPASLEKYIPPAVLNYWRRKYSLRKIDPNRIHFIAGLDILRDSDGNLSIIEVNTTVVSGIWSAEDLIRPLQSDLGQNVSNLGALKAAFSEMIASLPDPQGEMLNVQYDIYTPARIDDFAAAYAKSQNRVEELNHAFGMRSVYLGPLETPRHFWNSLVPEFLEIDANHARSRTGGEFLSALIRNGQLELREAKGSEVSYLPVRLLWHHLTNEHLFEYLPGVWSLFQKNKLAMVQTPGVEILENKLFQSYMDAMIRDVLGEEPIIPLSQTEGFFDDNGRFSPQKFSEIAAYPESWVIKPVAEQGGDGVIIGNELADNSKREMLRARLQANPFSYIAQKKITSSVVPPTDGKFRFAESLQWDNPGRKIDFRSFAFARTVNGVAKVSALPLISSRGVESGARTHNVAGNVDKSSLQLVLPRKLFRRLSCDSTLSIGRQNEK